MLPSPRFTATCPACRGSCSLRSAFLLGGKSRPRRCGLVRPALFVLLATLGGLAEAAADDGLLRDAVARPILEPNRSLEEVKAFCRARVVPMPDPQTLDEWEQYARQTRQAMLDNVVLRGEAAEWSRAPLQVEWLETIDGGPEYHIRKLRYEAVPGLWIPALLYEPRRLEGQVPVVLNVNGHDGTGKAAVYKQERCINLAKRGMLALNPEWLGMGQLRGDDFAHYRMNQLDLCGTSGLAPFYLCLSRGLDVLLQHPHADPRRVAVAGLSGGGWQSIVISSLDARVTLSNPVAGYSSFITRGEVMQDLGDSEQTPTDMAVHADYAQLTALRAPRPTLLTYNDRDNCCFAAGHALPPLLDAARPIYRLYGRPENLTAHINHVPGTHNFERDNREAFYRMLGDHFYPDQDFDWREIDCSSEIKTFDELQVPLPEENSGFNTLARRAMQSLPRPSAASNPERQRARLAEIVHCREYEVTDVHLARTQQLEGTQVHAWALRIGRDWTVPAVEVVPENVQGTIVLLADGGRSAAADRIASLAGSGHRVVAVDPYGFGESTVARRPELYSLLVAAAGERPLGVQSAQIRAVCRWLAVQQQTGPVTLVAVGRRTGLGALIAAALDNQSIATLQVDRPFRSLRQIIEENLQIPDGPELFCFGLLAEFDVPQMQSLAASVATASAP